MYSDSVGRLSWAEYLDEMHALENQYDGPIPQHQLDRVVKLKPRTEFAEEMRIGEAG